jgi:DNA-binding MarR family transcriptional regulator
VPELRHLRYFVAVAEELNFSAAARREFVSQQALSRIIQQLEAELGVLLFERTSRSVRLTPAGEAMLAAARRPQPPQTRRSTRPAVPSAARSTGQCASNLAPVYC